MAATTTKAWGQTGREKHVKFGIDDEELGRGAHHKNHSFTQRHSDDHFFVTNAARCRDEEKNEFEGANGDLIEAGPFASTQGLNVSHGQINSKSYFNQLKQDRPSKKINMSGTSFGQNLVGTHTQGDATGASSHRKFDKKNLIYFN